MKKAVKLLAAAVMLLVMFSMTAFAAGWATGQGTNSGRWWYDHGD